MQLSLTTLFATLSSLFRSRAALELENLALRHQIGIFQRSARKRPKLAPWDRLLWVWFSRLKSHWRSALAIVQPETVVAWHRADFRLFLELEGAARKTRTAGDYPRGSRVAPDETATVGPNQVAKSNTA